jgi:purine-binding chemotaxis protein CheW
MKVKKLATNDTTEKILTIRAEQLAQKGHSQEPRRNYITVIEFRMSHEIYAIELTHIRAIHPLKNLTYIPGAPGFIKGIFNLRGEIISVVDLKHFFDLPDQEPGNSSQVIILSSGHMEFRILSDAILGVTEINTDDIVDSLPTFTGVRLEYLKGVTGKGVAILDDEKLLNDKKMIISL